MLIVRGFTVLLTLGISLAFSACGTKQAANEGAQPASSRAGAPTGAGPATDDMSAQTLSQGKEIFRFDTFGNEPFWTDTLRLHEVIEQSIDPTTALKVGLKVDADALPPGILDKVDLKSPATTVALLKMNAVVGLKAEVDANNHILRLGITCALCHASVDNSLMPGIGRRMDGWPNRDLNVGAIIALSPAVPPDQKAIYNSWGPGKYDPRFNIDAKSTPLVLPPAYGLANVTNETYTAEGPMSYWNAYVAVTQMHGHGSFSDPRLGINISNSPDMVGPKLPALRSYQHSLGAPAAPAGSFDAAAAERGRTLFDQSCISCHVGVTGTDNNSGKLHSPDETGVDGAYASRTANRAYRTTPLRGLWQHPPYFHDGSSATLADVVSHYNRVRKLEMSEKQQEDLVEFLKSL